MPTAIKSIVKQVSMLSNWIESILLVVFGSNVRGYDVRVFICLEGCFALLVTGLSNSFVFMWP